MGWVYIILAVSLLPTFRPPKFQSIWEGMCIRMVGGLEGLKPQEKRLICIGLIINELGNSYYFIWNTRLFFVCLLCNKN